MAEAKKSAKKAEESEIKNESTEESIPTPSQAAEEQEVAEKATTKAGKHSKKGVEVAEEKAKKEARKKGELEESDAEKLAPKKVQKPARSRAERAGKKYREALKLVDKSKEYTVKEAIGTIIKTSPTKFDATIELHIRLGVDPKQADQNIRGNLVLPEGTGKTVKIAVFGEADTVAEAKKAGADIAGGDDFLQQLEKGKTDFDILIATPNVMTKLGKYARVLGPKGLMPNPKSGTVTTDVAKAISEAKAGKVEYRVDSTGIVHVAAGKVSFGEAKLEKNLNALLASIKSAKPASVKGVYVKSIFLTTTMGPSVRIAASEL